MIAPQNECNYCKENIQHDGKCYGLNARKSYSTLCLGFRQDPRGTIKFTESEGVFKINSILPVLGKWSDDYTLVDLDTPLKFTKITPVRWITEGMIAIYCKVSFYYYDNSEFDGQGEKKLAEVIPMFKNRTKPCCK